MQEVVAVRFKSNEKIFYLKNNSISYKLEDLLVCKTLIGEELGRVCFCGKININNLEVKNFKDILRKATKKDVSTYEENLKFEKKAFKLGENLIKKQKLNMQLILVVCSLDRKKTVFFFKAQDRVDFRNLVKKLALTLHTRVELRQIGIRDEAKMLCGIGICGRPFCCSSFLWDFHHVSIKMAKEQNLSLNPKKISGCCGKLMCCLQYEQDSYEFLNKICPKVGECVMSPDGEGVVCSGNPLTGKYRVKLKEEEFERVFNKDSLKIIKKINVSKKSSKD